MAFDLCLSETAGSRSLDRLVGCGNGLAKHNVTGSPPVYWLIQKPRSTIRTSRNTSNRGGGIRNHGVLSLRVLLDDDRVLPANRRSVVLVRNQGVGRLSASFDACLHKVKSTITVRH